MTVSEKPPFAPLDRLDQPGHVFRNLELRHDLVRRLRGAEMQRAVRGRQGADHGGYRIGQGGRCHEHGEGGIAQAVVDAQGAEASETAQLDGVREPGIRVHMAHHGEEIFVELLGWRRGREWRPLAMAGRQAHNYSPCRQSADHTLVNLFRVSVVDVASSVRWDIFRLIRYIRR